MDNLNFYDLLFVVGMLCLAGLLALVLFLQGRSRAKREAAAELARRLAKVKDSPAEQWVDPMPRLGSQPERRAMAPIKVVEVKRPEVVPIRRSLTETSAAERRRRREDDDREREQQAAAQRRRDDETQQNLNTGVTLGYVAGTLMASEPAKAEEPASMEGRSGSGGFGSREAAEPSAPAAPTASPPPEPERASSYHAPAPDPTPDPSPAPDYSSPTDTGGGGGGGGD